MALVSVIIPVFNPPLESGLFQKSIYSILNQTHKELEVIIIDDFSKENIREILSTFKDNRIIYVKNKYSKGISGALNTGIELSTGQFIARHDCDDISLPNRIETQLKLIQRMSSDNVVAVGSQLILKDSNGKYIGRRDYPTNPKDLAKLIFKRMPIAHPALLGRAEIIKRCKYPENYNTSEDVLFYFQLLKQGQFSNTKESLYEYTISENSNSFKNLKRSLRLTIKALVEGMTRYKIYPSIQVIPSFISLFLKFALVMLIGNRLAYKVYKIMEDQSKIEFVKYLIVGAITNIVDLIIFSVGVNYLRLNILLADIIKYPIFFALNYFGHSKFTFSDRNSKGNGPRYLIYILFNQFIAWILLLIISFYFTNSNVVKFLQIVFQVPISFYLLKFGVFRSISSKILVSYE